MADISSLGNLAPAGPVDMEVYKTINAARPQGLPPAGEYEIRLPESFPSSCFGKTREGQLKITFDASIASGDRTGFPIRRVSLSAKTWTDQKTGKTVSQVAEFLAALGYQGSTPTDPQEIADMVEAQAGRVVKVYVNWEANHFASQFEVKGMKNFPVAADGTRQSFVTHPTETDAEGNPLRLRANLVVKRWLVSSDTVN